MAVLTVRNVPDDIHRELRRRAARAQRSMEAEVRDILTRACVADRPLLSGADLQAWALAQYDGRLPEGAVDDLIAERRAEAGRDRMHAIREVHHEATARARRA